MISPPRLPFTVIVPTTPRKPTREEKEPSVGVCRKLHFVDENTLVEPAVVLQAKPKASGPPVKKKKTRL